MFQSTRPMRGATGTSARVHVPFRFQSTRPMRGATATRDNHAARNGGSIHAPRAGRDMDLLNKMDGVYMFQSTRPVRGATRNPAFLCASRNVSIHAPRAGRDHSRRL